jgi:CheY-like chemotaxis protein
MSRKILLADDSVTIQKVIELTFMDEDYDVSAVSNGDEAVAALSRSAPDLVLADVHMPGASGYEVCRRSKELHPLVPVLLLVGTFEPFDEAKSREVGADSFLKKPFDSQELLQLVAQLLGGGAAATPPANEPAPAPAAPQPAWAREPEPAAAPVAATPVPAAPGPEPVWSDLEVEPEPPPAEMAPPFYGEPIGAPQEADPFRWEVEPEELAPEPFAEPEPVFELPRAIGFRTPAASLEEPVPAPAEAAAAAAPAGGGQAFPLSDADVERIARRVAELVGERLVRDVVWEVVPDMAEVVIKERLRELESQVE